MIFPFYFLYTFLAAPRRRQSLSLFSRLYRLAHKKDQVMSNQTIEAPASEAELSALRLMKADYTAMPGERCEVCQNPMTAGQPFYCLGSVRRKYVCACCGLKHVRDQS